MRDRLLQLLFNLIKRPDADQRRSILTGMLAIASTAEGDRVEAEMLPQLWEQVKGIPDEGCGLDGAKS